MRPLLIAGWMFCGIATAQPAGVPPPEVELVHIVSQPMLASALLGLEVRTRGGEPAGTLEDLVLDLERNRVRDALVGTPRGRVAVGLLDLRLSLERTYAMLPSERDRVRPARGKPAGPTARALLGRPLYARDGTKIGALEHVLVDAHAGRVPFVVVRMQEKRHPLPLDALRSAADRLTLRIDARELRGAPSFSAGELEAKLGDGAFLRRNAEYADRLTAGR
jgi:sporulation protein YlmC with PRC-barrel domain